METWNSLNFPYKLSTRIIGDKYVVTYSKYLLDDLEGDIDLEDAPIEEYFTLISDTAEHSTHLANILINVIQKEATSN